MHDVHEAVTFAGMMDEFDQDLADIECLLDRGETGAACRAFGRVAAWYGEWEPLVDAYSVKGALRDRMDRLQAKLPLRVRAGRKPITRVAAERAAA